MNFVEPIRDIEIIQKIASNLKKQNERDYMMFCFGIYTGLRISDILKFRVKDVKGKRGYNIRETKTGKQKSYDWNPALKKELEKYIETKDEREYLFPSRQGNKPITRQRAYQILKKACEVEGISNIGTHTLRKTFGYHTYQNTKDLGLLMDMFNHASEIITMKYIGLTQEMGNKAIKKLKYF